MMYKFLTIFLILLISPMFAGVIDGFEWFQPVLNTFNFFPEFFLEAYASSFQFHKNLDYKNRYLIEINTDLALAMIDFREQARLYVDFSLRLGMGQQVGAIAYDPRDIRIGYAPYLEYYFDKFTISTGIQHYCYHNIDRYENPTEFWNKYYFGIQSPNYRLSHYRKGIITDENWDMASRMEYMARVGYFLYGDDLFSAGGGIDYRADFQGENRFAFYKRLSWVVNTKTFTKLTLTRDDELLTTLCLGLEGNFRRGTGGFMLFADYYAIDQFTVLPKDKLLEFGVRFYL